MLPEYLESMQVLARDNMPRASDLLLSVSVSADIYKTKIVDLALAASEELRQMAQQQEPLWLFDTNKQTEVLNEPEYKRRFVHLDPTLEGIIKFLANGGPIDMPEFNGNVEVEMEHSSIPSDIESSRAIGIVLVDPINLVHMLMNVGSWSCVFSNIVSKATNLGLLLTGGDGNVNGSLQVVTWVENNVVCDGSVPEMFRQTFKSGVAFSAKRWMLTMERHYDRHAMLQKQHDQLLGQPLRDINVGEEQKNLMKLAERMIKSYDEIFSSCDENQWMPLSIHGGEDIFAKTSMNLDVPGTPRGVSVMISTSVWLPIPQNDLFKFFRAGENRWKWDLLSYCCMTRDVLHIPSARDPANAVSLVLVEAPNGRTDKSEIFYLQESFTDSTAMYVIYAPIDTPAVHYIMEGKDSDRVDILASGFAVLPCTPRGSILTIAFHIMDEELSTPEYLPPRSVYTAKRLVSETVSLIKASLMFSSAC